jgi:hypothetical protein
VSDVAKILCQLAAEAADAIEREGRSFARLAITIETWEEENEHGLPFPTIHTWRTRIIDGEQQKTVRYREDRLA